MKIDTTKIKCYLGFHKYGPWEDVPYPEHGLDPALMFWPMPQKKCQCQHCGVWHWQDR